MPSDGAPADGAPSDGAPTDGTPTDRTPTDGTPTDGTPRDRDPSGRPRNARPRDGLGRPLARDAGQQGADAGQDRIPDDLAITGHDAAVLAARLLRDDRPFHAHEVLEAAWKTGPPADRDLWQGLAQIAVGLTHARRGNARGAVTLLRRGTQRIRAYQAKPALPANPTPATPPAPPTDSTPPATPTPPAAPGLPAGPSPAAAPGLPAGPTPPVGSGSRALDDDHPYGMDIPAVLAAADELASRIEQHGLDHVPHADLTLRLLAGDP